MSHFTKQDAVELSVPLPLLVRWETAMNQLWSFFLAYHKKERNVKVDNKNNVIFFQLRDGYQFKIFINFMNSKFLSLQIEIEGHETFAATIDNISELGHEGMIRTVANILTYADKVKSTKY